MSATEITLAVSAIVSIGGFAWSVWSQRHKPKIDRKAAVDAEQKTISEIRTADIDGLRDIIASLREEVAALRPLREEVKELRGRVETAEQGRAAAEARAAHAEAMWRQEAAYVEVLLDHWPTPPPPPRPA